MQTKAKHMANVCHCHPELHKVNSWDAGNALIAGLLQLCLLKYNPEFCPPIWFAGHNIFADRHCVFQHLRPKMLKGNYVYPVLKENYVSNLLFS